MKLEEHKKEKQQEKIEIVNKQQQEAKKVFEGRMLPKKGHTLFEVDLKTLTVQKATFDEPPLLTWEKAVKKDFSFKKTITKKQGCIYISALNETNVLKILKREFSLL